MSAVDDMSVREIRIDWRGIGMTLIFHPYRWGGPCDHIEIFSDGRVPLPVTETGYKSHFVVAGTIPPEALVDHVTAWLDENARSDRWKEQRQLSLF
ncbi:MAG: hypothetical protein EP341_11690 [Sphingomonadales bacterium]|nr:MAG: hypothetical protein EP341_11690 [Sphingomonadales bacterium]